jgi:hypothetical protein
MNTTTAQDNSDDFVGRRGELRLGEQFDAPRRVHLDGEIGESLRHRPNGDEEMPRVDWRHLPNGDPV